MIIDYIIHFRHKNPTTDTEAALLRGVPSATRNLKNPPKAI
jgi:hypothetical protein